MRPSGSSIPVGSSSRFGGRGLIGSTLLAVLVVLTGSSLATAEWIVMRDGSRLETKGPWKQSGEIVIFTLPNGTLSSVRVADVDLEASHQASSKTQTDIEEIDEPGVGGRKAVFVLTDADVGHPSSTTADEPPSPEDPAANGSQQEEAVQVISWRNIGGLEDDGVILAGRARNVSESVAAGLSLVVTLYDADGSVMATQTATLGAASLGPGQAASFRAEFPGTFDFSATRFEFSSQLLKTNVNPPGPGLGRLEEDD